MRAAFIAGPLNVRHPTIAIVEHRAIKEREHTQTCQHVPLFYPTLFVLRQTVKHLSKMHPQVPV